MNGRGNSETVPTVNQIHSYQVFTSYRPVWSFFGGPWIKTKYPNDRRFFTSLLRWTTSRARDKKPDVDGAAKKFYTTSRSIQALQFVQKKRTTHQTTFGLNRLGLLSRPWRLKKTFKAFAFEKSQRLRISRLNFGSLRRGVRTWTQRTKDQNKIGATNRIFFGRQGRCVTVWNPDGMRRNSSILTSKYRPSEFWGLLRG